MPLVHLKSIAKFTVSPHSSPSPSDAGPWPGTAVFALGATGLAEKSGAQAGMGDRYK